MIAALVSLLLMVLLSPFPLGVLSMYAVTRAPCGGGGAVPAGYEAVQIDSPSGIIPSLFSPSASGAVVIMAPPLSGGAASELPYGEMFRALDLGVLMLPSRVCWLGVNSFGYLEAQDVEAAYRYLQTRADVDAQRVSVHGFSAAGAAALYAMARVPELRAASAMGNYHDFEAVIDTPDWVGRLYAAGVRWGFQRSTDVPISALKPIAHLPEIAPRPLLFIYGSLESSLGGGRLMYQQAGASAEFWEVPAIGHGGYLQAYPQETRTILGGFHVRALLAEGTP